MFANILLRTVLPANLLSERLTATAGNLPDFVLGQSLHPEIQVVALHRMSRPLQPILVSVRPSWQTVSQWHWISKMQPKI